MQVNRSLDNQAMNEIDHALGRPLDPMKKSYRNYYVTDGAVADEMAASPFWVEGRPDTRYRCFAVTDVGRRALTAHLREISDPHRAFVITFDGHARSVVAKSRDKARYSHFLDLSDVMPDLTFIDFCRRVSVSADRPGIAS